MMPEPVPAELPELTLIVTTLGEAFCAAAVTALTLSVLLTMTGLIAAWAVLAVVAGASGQRAATPEATPPPRRPAAVRHVTKTAGPTRFLSRGRTGGAGGRGV
jgi:hypothetical protein